MVTAADGATRPGKFACSYSREETAPADYRAVASVDARLEQIRPRCRMERGYHHHVRRIRTRYWCALYDRFNRINWPEGKNKESCYMAETRPIRVLVAKPGLDGHDRGAKVIA